MKTTIKSYWISIWVLAAIFPAFAQNNLPPCQGIDVITWNNCFGEESITMGSRTDKYVGSWKNGKYHGSGVFIIGIGEKYTGEFQNGLYHGQGTFLYKNGNKYIGEYKNDKKNGRGTFTYSNGSNYIGEWKDGLRAGFGTLYSTNGAIVNKGVWVNDKFISSE
jgi:hypothetical protein